MAYTQYRETPSSVWDLANDSLSRIALRMVKDISHELDTFRGTTFANTCHALASHTTELKPMYEVRACDDHYDIEVELPGFERDAVNIDLLDDNVLEVSCERKRVHLYQKPDIVQYTERFYGKLHLSVQLPQDASADGISATMKNGLLTVHVPQKVTKKTVRKIAVN